MKKTAQIKTTKTRRKYDDAFKQQALQLIRLRQSVPSVAQSLGIGEGMLFLRSMLFVKAWVSVAVGIMPDNSTLLVRMS